MKIIFKSK